jgi:hypothetical protein
MWVLSIQKHGTPLVQLPLPLSATALRAASDIVGDQVRAEQRCPQELLEVWICRRNEGELVQEHRLVDPFADALLPDCMDTLTPDGTPYACCPMLRGADLDICEGLDASCMRACVRSLPAGSPVLAANQDYLRELYAAAVPKPFCVKFYTPEQLLHLCQIRICRKHLMELSAHDRGQPLLLVYVPLYIISRLLLSSPVACEFEGLVARAFTSSHWALRVRVVSDPERVKSVWLELPSRKNFRLSEADPGHLYACCRECEV